MMIPKASHNPLVQTIVAPAILPLLLMEKYTWTTDETFTAEIKIAHYGAADIPA